MDDVIRKSLAKSKHESSREVLSILNKKSGAGTISVDFGNVWNWQDFGLGESKKISQSAQRLILAELARKRFLEAYYIEKAGMSFAAKMSLLSESLEEQCLFSHFAAEEARHFEYVSRVLSGENLSNGKDDFILFLNEVISSGARRPLIFIIQVVLEGWGIDHYARMERSCLHPEIKSHLRLILKDEASHHGSGVALFSEKDMTPAEIDYTAQMMASFIKMVRVGPVSMYETVKKHAPEISAVEFRAISNAAMETQRKLDYLKAMIQKAGANQILQRLGGLFSPDLLT